MEGVRTPTSPVLHVLNFPFSIKELKNSIIFHCLFSSIFTHYLFNNIDIHMNQSLAQPIFFHWFSIINCAQ
ncbi:hypothetical protein FRX31_013158, partial [Thalictrum thalictroides]